MKPATLKHIQKEVRKFANLYEKLVEHWNGKLEHGNHATYPVTVLVSIILSNIAFDGSNCHGYKHEERVQQVRNYIAILKEIDSYENELYMTHYAYREVSSIFEGNEMTEFYED